MKYILTLIICFMFSGATAQEFIIKLEPVADTLLKSRNFYFDKVEDGREENQGKRIVGHFGRNGKSTAVLDNDLEPFFLSYLEKVYPKREGDKPMTLRVNVLECSSTGGALSEARVKLDIDIINSATEEPLTNLTLDRTKQPLMGGKTFGVLIAEIVNYGVGMAKVD